MFHKITLYYFYNYVKTKFIYPQINVWHSFKLIKNNSTYLKKNQDLKGNTSLIYNAER